MQRVGHHQDYGGLSGIRLTELSAALSLLQLWHDSSGIAAAYDAALVQQQQCSSNNAAASAAPLSVLYEGGITCTWCSTCYLERWSQ